MTSPAPDKPSPDKQKVPVNGFLSQMCSVNVSSIPASLRATEADLEDEISHYLRFEGGVPDVQEPLEWWKYILAQFLVSSASYCQYLATHWFISYHCLYGT